ncbi:hypothetical protein [Shimazuella alba]|uniref:Uncharacterized protein n=1 Tax=Shimazuella alba TaxID=2690964 RepID=A0A6I4VY02_9BACL|nr:hypothetical protein [Shimazuella alba]MXQ55743.1 hypothetical protein [Shimazuella alba]
MMHSTVPSAYWWGNYHIGRSIRDIVLCYGWRTKAISRRPQVRDDNQVRKIISNNLSDLGSKETLQGGVAFFSRVEDLRQAVVQGDARICYLLAQALEKHFLADSILFQASNRGASEEEVWNRLANSPERVQLLAEAEELKRQVK